MHTPIVETSSLLPHHVKKSYRFEQGFTYELNLSGVSDEARQAFIDKRDARFEK